MVKLAIAYNPFDLTDLQQANLAYDQNKTLADYLEGLPKEVAWTVGYCGQPVKPEDWATIRPTPNSNIVLVRTPEGGRGGKTAMRIVAMIALMVAAPHLGAMLLPSSLAGSTLAASIASATVLVTGAVVINALLPPTAGMKKSKEESNTYGIDGPKNTAQEGGVVPIGYGEYRIGGNIVDLFTRNVGKDQYLFIRTVLNQGEIEAIEDIEINGEPLSSFENVQVRKRFGLDTEQPNDWFDESTRLINHNLHLDTDWSVRGTTGQVDRIRLDVMFPMGLYSIDQDDGSTKDQRQVTLEFEYAPCDNAGNLTGSWSSLPLLSERPVTTSGANFLSSSGTNTASLTVETNDYIGSGQYRLEGFYRPVGATDWVSAGVVTGSPTTNVQAGRVRMVETTWPTVQYTFHFPTSGAYEMRVEGGAATEGYSIGEESVTTALTIRDNTSKPKRLTYESAVLDRGYYKVRARRTDQEKLASGKQVDYVYDEVYLTDIGEIDRASVNLNGIANLSLCIKASEQISGIPTVTARCKFSKLKVYDEEGAVVATQWSDNPADIVVDMLTHPIRGAGYSPSKIVWSKYIEFRDYCEAEGLKFNGVFDTANTLWDAMQTVAKIGHGTVVPRGTKFSFAVDMPADPVALFTPANIFEDSFKKTWLSLTERANEIQLRFQDKEDGYKEATVRLADNAAFARGERQKIATVEGFGITDLDQAISEAEYHARQNSYIRSFIEFDAPLEAIGVTIGDVALIQHNSVDFLGGTGGRFASGSTTTSIKLDRQVHMVTGKQYALLGFHSALKRYDVTVTNILGSRVTVTGLPDVDPNALLRCARAKQGSVDVEIIDIVKVGSTFKLIVDDTTGITTGAMELWDIDVIEERDVVNNPGDHDTITVTSAFSQAPEQFANFLFGEKSTYREPYRLRSISGDGIEKRTLSFVQYDARCYERGGWDVPAITRPVRQGVGQVRDLVAEYTKTPLPEQDRIPITLSWNVPLDTIYAGADIYVSQDGRWRIIGSSNGTEFRADFSRGESVKFKVVAFDDSKARALFSAAPTIDVNLDLFEVDLATPSNLAYELWWRTEATARVSWDAPAGADPLYNYRIAVKTITEADYDALVTDPTNPLAEITDDADYLTVGETSTLKADVPRLDKGWYVVRVRSQRGFHASPWVYLGIVVEAADISIPVTGLKLVGGINGAGAANDTFNTADASWTWDDILAQAVDVTDPKTNLPLILQDYQVRILDDEENLIRTEYVTSPSYTYNYSKNAEDSADVTDIRARRVLRIQVRIRGKQGQLGIPASMRVTNPAPATPSGIGNREDINGVLINWDDCPDNDYAETIVWLGTTPAFTVSGANQVFSGKANNCRIVVPTQGDYYIRVGHNDVFSKTPVNISSGISLFIPTLAVEALQDLSDNAAALRDEIEQIAIATLANVIKFPALDTKIEQLINLKRQEVGTLIMEETTQRIEGQTAIAEKLAIIGAVSGDGLSFILDQDKVKVSPTESLAQRLSQIASSINDTIALVESEATTRATADSAEATARLALQAQIDGDISAAILNEQTARVDGDNALASSLALLGAKNSGGTAWILDTAKVQVGGGVSLATRLSGLDSSIAGANANISSEVIARVNGDNALASSISTLSTTVGGHTASITTLQSTTNGLRAKYGVSLDVNGHITGFLANNDGVTGDFVIVADRFAIVDPSNGTGPSTVPFQYSGGQIYMPNVIVERLKANSVTAESIIGGAVSTMLHYEAENARSQVVGSEIEDISFNFTATGGDVLVQVYGEIGTTTNAAAGTVVKLYCDGAVVGRGAIYCPASWGGTGTGFPFSHRPAAGTHTYRVTYTATSGSGPSRINRTLCVVTELKK